MTDVFPAQAALVAAHKQLAQRLRQALQHLAPQVAFSHSQALHVVAALHGVANWQTLSARPQQVRLPQTAALEALQQALTERGIMLQERVLAQVLVGLSPLTFTVLDEEISDIPAKTTVRLSLLLEGLITPDTLRALLLAEFERISQRRGFRYHTHPTSIFIWAYPSEAHHRGEAAQQAGMLQRSHADFQAGRPPQVTIAPDLIRAVQEPEVTRFGLSEAVRRVLFLDHCRVTNRARIAADKAHPIGFENTREAMRLNSESKHAHLIESDKKLAARHGLTDEQYQEVIGEGFVRFWPMAAMMDTTTESID